MAINRVNTDDPINKEANPSPSAEVARSKI